MFIIAVTGGIGSGKSAATQYFRSRGAHTLILDDIARAILSPGSEASRRVLELWGSVADSEGRIDRSALANIVFHDDTALRQLEAITHPATWERVDEEIERIWQEDNNALVVLELALLAGSSRERWADVNLGIIADMDVRLERLQRYRGMREDEARARIAAQASDSEVHNICDVVIDNSGTLAELKKALDVFWSDQVQGKAKYVTEKR